MEEKVAFNVDVLEKDLNSKIKGANAKLAEKFIKNHRAVISDVRYNENSKLIRIEGKVLSEYGYPTYASILVDLRTSKIKECIADVSHIVFTRKQ